MYVGFSREEEAFRREVQAFLRDYRDLEGFFWQGARWEQVKPFYQALGRRGWMALGWPAEVGGLGKGPVHEYILWDECAYVRAARPPLGAGIVAKSIIAYGTDEQKARLLPPIRSADAHYSLGYSEPEAGSDLAGVRTRAQRHGDTYRVTGGKLWTSYAQDSDYLWLLARTGAPEARGRALSLFVLDLHAPGVHVEPLPTLDGEQLNQVHLDGVEVPAGNRIGPENGAWRIMAEALAVERHVQFPPKRLRRDLEDVVAWVREQGRSHDPVIRHRIASLAARVAECEMHALLVLDATRKGVAAVALAAANKVAGSEACQEIARAALDFGLPEALVTGAMPEYLWRQSMWETIGGGTSEVMRGVVARQGLGLGGRS